jgi:periplasmic divalent cation tolerance protein
MTDCVVVFVTAPNEEEAVKMSKDIVEARLAACANIVGSVRSIYRWEGKVQDDAEVLVVLKTRRSLFPQLQTRVKELHSYSVPEVIALPVVGGSEEYLRWIAEETG